MIQTLAFRSGSRLKKLLALLKLTASSSSLERSLNPSTQLGGPYPYNRSGIVLKGHIDAVEAHLLAISRIPVNAGHPLHKGTPREAFIREVLEKHVTAQPGGAGAADKAGGM